MERGYCDKGHTACVFNITRISGVSSTKFQGFSTPVHKPVDNRPQKDAGQLDFVKPTRRLFYFIYCKRLQILAHRIKDYPLHTSQQNPLLDRETQIHCRLNLYKMKEFRRLQCSAFCLAFILIHSLVGL